MGVGQRRVHLLDSRMARFACLRAMHAATVTFTMASPDASTFKLPATNFQSLQTAPLSTPWLNSAALPAACRF
eukprot:366227-Chlamydomonas_euryale.AAC.10